MSKLFQHMHVSPLKASLVTAVFSSSYFFFGNLGASNFGIVPAIRDEEGADLTASQKVALQSWHYDNAKLHMGGSAALTGLSLSTAAYLSRSRCMRYIMLGAASLSVIIVPFTLILMAPTNKEIAELAATDALVVPAGAERSADQSLLERRALGKIEKWRKLHAVRILLGAGAWVGTLVAFSYGV
ncbi:hypothetical protein HWV62_5664 [Athelia sp. TMB]|nr:hypothetical protein HWV62_5664 [Athelia sp. TMB]